MMNCKVKACFIASLVFSVSAYARISSNVTCTNVGNSIQIQPFNRIHKENAAVSIMVSKYDFDADQGFFVSKNERFIVFEPSELNIEESEKVSIATEKSCYYSRQVFNVKITFSRKDGKAMPSAYNQNVQGDGKLVDYFLCSTSGMADLFMIGRREPCKTNAPQIRVVNGRDEKKTEFIQDSSHPKLGNAWKDPTGMIWGDMVTAEQGKDYCNIVDDKCFMSQATAVSYCESIGAQLPSFEDFVRLRVYMGATEELPDGYQPQVLPNLLCTGQRCGLFSNLFWSSSIDPNHSDSAYNFAGVNGYIYPGFRAFSQSNNVRCVVVEGK